MNNYTRVTSLDAALTECLSQVDCDEAFWTADFNKVRESMRLWNNHLPTVMPHYAVKCCDEPNLLRFLAKSGYGFDCASKNEIEKILSLGVDCTRIVFSHPLKSIQALHYAKEQGVDQLVFDSIDELNKILKYYPDAHVFLRVKPRFSRAKIQLSDKFGCDTCDAKELINQAKELNANFIGFSYHVGSLCDDVSTFREAIEYVAELIDYAIKVGHRINFIDIGGGFLHPHAECNLSFPEIGDAITDALCEFFEGEDIRVIGEPGRFIAAEYMDLHVPIIGLKMQKHPTAGITQHIYIADGIYGAFNAILNDHAEPHFEIFSSCNSSTKVNTTMWGQTCDSADVVYGKMEFPTLSIGDLLTVRNFGAYTYAPTSFFNGFAHHKVFLFNEQYQDEEIDY